MFHTSFKVFVAALAASTLVGCASQVRLSPQPMGDQFSAYENGVRSLGSSGQSSLVMLKPLNNTVSKRATFVVTFKNKSSRPLDVSTEFISVSGPEGAYKVYSYEELVAEEQSRQSVAMAQSVFAVALQGANTGLMQAGGGDPTAFSNTAQNIAVMQNLAQGTMDESEAKLQQYEQTILRRNTVMPGGVAGGYFEIDVPEGPFTIDVRAGDDVHSFRIGAEAA